jgi:hypothetical protein
MLSKLTSKTCDLNVTGYSMPVIICIFILLNSVSELIVL